MEKWKSERDEKYFMQGNFAAFHPLAYSLAI